jgi:hypothetical protein
VEEKHSLEVHKLPCRILVKPSFLLHHTLSFWKRFKPLRKHLKHVNMSSTQTMKAVNYQGAFKVKVEDVPMPKLEHPDDVIVKVTTSGVHVFPVKRKSCTDR